MRISAALSRGHAFTLPLVGGILLATPLAAQTDAATDSVIPMVTGVVWTPVNVAVAGARVTIARPGPAGAESVITDDDGAFRFRAVPRGPVTFQVRRVGFAVATVTLDVPSADGGPMLLELTPTAPSLTPVVVRAARPTAPIGPFTAFNQRRSTGFGHFITREEIERRRPMRTTDLFRMVPGARLGRNAIGTPSVRFRGSTCDPEIVLDGMQLGPGVFDIDAVAPGSIEGMEIYSGAATVPIEYRKGFGRTSCGLIVFWTRQGEPRPKRKRKAEPAVSAAALADLVAASHVYTSDQVDVAATTEQDIGALVRYPEALRGAERMAASAVVEFVVDAKGSVEAATINFVAVPAPPFAAALRTALPDLRFSPAMKNGAGVRQVVQLGVRFDPTPQRSGGAAPPK
jgi:TonB family protein